MEVETVSDELQTTSVLDRLKMKEKKKKKVGDLFG